MAPLASTCHVGSDGCRVYDGLLNDLTAGTKSLAEDLLALLADRVPQLAVQIFEAFRFDYRTSHALLPVTFFPLFTPVFVHTQGKGRRGITRGRSPRLQQLFRLVRIPVHKLWARHLIYTAAEETVLMASAMTG